MLRGKSGELPDLVHTHPSETVRDAIGILREYGVSQMPVVGAEPPVMAGEVAGSVSERELLSAVFEGRAKLADAVSLHMGPPLPLIGAGELVSAAAKALRDWDARDGRRGRQAGRRHHPPRPARLPVRRPRRLAAGILGDCALPGCRGTSQVHLCRFTSADQLCSGRRHDRTATRAAAGELPAAAPASGRIPPTARRWLPPAASAGRRQLPPPPPPQGGYAPPPPGAGFGAPPAPASRSVSCRRRPTRRGAPRVIAWIIDYIPYFIVVGIGYGIEAATQETACVTDTSEYNLGEFCATGNSTLGVAAFSLCLLIGLAYSAVELGYRQGTTGSSIGKSIMKFKVVSEKTGQPIGFGLSIVRQLAHFVDAHHLLHRLPVPAVGRQAPDSGRQDHDHGLPTALKKGCYEMTQPPPGDYPPPPRTPAGQLPAASAAGQLSRRLRHRVATPPGWLPATSAGELSASGAGLRHAGRTAQRGLHPVAQARRRMGHRQPAGVHPVRRRPRPDVCHRREQLRLDER